MAYKVIQAALTTSTESLYVFVADGTDDLKYLPNLTQTGSTSDARWYAKAGSVARLIGDGHWYILSPSNVWNAMLYMSDDVDDAISKNVETMRQYLVSTEEYKTAAAASAEAALESESNAAGSASAALESQNAAKQSETNAASAAKAAGISASGAADSESAAAASAANAASSESAAADSQKKASDSESAANKSIVDAAASMNAAKKSEENASNSDGNAKNSADSAKKSAESASKSASAAAESESAASESEQNAANSESNAKGSADSAQKSEENAGLSEVAARSWTVGGPGTREGEDTNNAKYFAELLSDRTDKIPYLYAATFGVDKWSEVSGNDGYIYEQTADIFSADEKAPPITEESQFLSAGVFFPTDVYSTDLLLERNLAIINDGYTTSGNGVVTTRINMLPTSDITVYWVLAR